MLQSRFVGGTELMVRMGSHRTGGGMPMLADNVAEREKRMLAGAHDGLCVRHLPEGGVLRVVLLLVLCAERV